MALTFDFTKNKAGGWSLEPIAGMPTPLQKAQIREVVPLGTKYPREIKMPEPEHVFITPQKMTDIEYDPPTKSFLQKLLFDWMQRLNFAQANVYRTQLAELKTPEALAQRQTFKDKMMAEYPTMNSQIADQWATIQMAAGGKFVGMPATGAALVDLVLKKDSDRAAALWAGLSGADKSTFMDVMEEEGKPAILGLVLDMGLDPINYLPWGLAAKGIGKGVKAIPGIKRAGQVLAKTNVVKTLGKLFVPGYSLDKEYFAFESYMRRRAFAAEADVLTDLRKVWKQLQGNKQKVAKLMTHVKQNPGALNKLGEANQKIFLKYADKIDDIGKELVLKKYMPFSSYRKWKETYMYGFYPNYTRVLSGRIPPTKFQALAKASFSRPKVFAKVDEAKAFVKNLDLLKKADSYDDALDIAKKVFRDPTDIKAVTTKAKYVTVLEETGETQAKFIARKMAGYRKAAKDLGMPLGPGQRKHVLASWNRENKIRKLISPAVTTEVGKVSNIEQAIKVLDDLDQVKSYASALQASYTPEENFFKLYGIYKVEAGRLFRRDKFLTEVMDKWGQKVPNIFDPGTVPVGKKLVFPKGQLRFYPAGKATTNMIDDFLGTINEGDEFVDLTPKVREFMLKLAKKSGNEIGVSKKVAAYLVDEEIALRLNKMSSFFWGDPATAQVLKYFDKWYGTWKGMATAMRLPFHLRNAYSNMFLMYVMDVDPHMIPVRMQQAARLRLSEQIPRLAPKLKTVGGKMLSAKQIMMNARGDRVVGTAWLGAEGKSIWQQLDYFNKYGRLKAGINPIEWGRKAGTAIEDNARLALYIDKLVKGSTFREAAEAVFKGLYDYSPVGLTAFETNVMKRIMPFYTWARKNTPHMIHTMLTKPQKIANIGKVYRMLYDMAPETREERVYKPEYMGEQMWLKAPDWLPKLAGQTGPLYYHLDLPLGELSGDMKQIVNLINPLGLKPILDILRKHKDFPVMNMPIERFRGEKVPAPWFTAYMPDDMQKLFEVGTYTDRNTGKKILGMRARNRYLLFSMFPVIAEGAKLYPQPIDVELERTPWRLVTYMTGIGFMPVDVGTQKRISKMVQTGKRGELQRFLIQEGRLPTEEEWKEATEP